MALVVLGEQQLGLDPASPRAPSSRLRRSFWKSFSLTHSGTAIENDLNPRGANAR